MTLPRRKCIRVPGHDYGTVGCYFVTVCVADRRKCLCEIHEDRVDLKNQGLTVEAELRRLPERFGYVDLDAFQVMPDHVHFILCLVADSPEHTKFRSLGFSQSRSLPMVVNHFKGTVTKNLRRTVDPEFAWQRRFYERFIRHDRELHAIRDYIASNPDRWRATHRRDMP